MNGYSCVPSCSLAKLQSTNKLLAEFNPEYEDAQQELGACGKTRLKPDVLGLAFQRCVYSQTQRTIVNFRHFHLIATRRVLF